MDKHSVGTWAIVAVLMAILAAAIVYAYEGLTVHSELTMPLSGDIALGLGVLVSLLFGIGLMALVFYSSRAGYDDPPEIKNEHPDHQPQDSDPPNRTQ
ncbi:MAG TPA: hypothetical protein VH684_23900 [Xanthobacteraceae bacterium]